MPQVRGFKIKKSNSLICLGWKHSLSLPIFPINTNAVELSQSEISDNRFSICPSAKQNDNPSKHALLGFSSQQIRTHFNTFYVRFNVIRPAFIKWTIDIGTTELVKVYPKYLLQLFNFRCHIFSSDLAGVTLGLLPMTPN